MAVPVESITPIDSWVLLRVDPPKRKSGLIVHPAGTMSEKVGHSTGVIIKAGQGTLVFDENGKSSRKPLSVADGDRVLFRSYLKDLHQLGVEEKNVGLIHAKDILCILVES